MAKKAAYYKGKEVRGKSSLAQTLFLSFITEKEAIEPEPKDW
jgi:hypothetical protein